MNEINWKLNFYIPLYFPPIFDYVLFSHFYRIKVSNIKNKVNIPSGCFAGTWLHLLLITQRRLFTSAVDVTATLVHIRCRFHSDACSHPLLMSQRRFSTSAVDNKAMLFTSAVDFTATSSYLAGSTVDLYFIFLSFIYLFIY